MPHPASDLRQRLVAANAKEYGDSYGQLTFADATAARAASEGRQQLLAELAGRIDIGCGGSKLDMRRLSPGCRLCAAGVWSCLFINGRCNARCFYCPTDQDDIGLPTTNTVNFRTPADYVAYLERFGFRGASFSGGEPLLTPGRTLAFLAAAKRHFGDALHTWLYTNGTLLDRELLLRLRDAGLDEIRFDIGAVNYSLQGPQLAAGLIPTVTIEIPAVPEEEARLKALLPAMAACGVQHLNLHQLRLTPYSLPRFRGRPYTYLHGDRVTVLESELTALELIRYGLDHAIDLPINYCSFVYKQRYQRSAARRRGGEVMRKAYEELTAAGYIRTLCLSGASEVLTRQAQAFAASGAAAELWSLSAASEGLAFSPRLWPLVDVKPLQLRVSYAEAGMRAAVSYRNPFTEVKLSPRTKVVIERWRVGAETELSEGAAQGFARLLLYPDQDGFPGEGSGELAPLMTYETLATGLQEYF